MICLTLFDVQSQRFIPLTLYGASAGVGLPVGGNLSTFSPTFFGTSKPMIPDDFDGRVTVTGADLTVLVGGSAAWCTFWNVDHDPYWLDIGGLQVGVSGGVSAGIYYASTSPKNARDNDGCLIAPGGDPLCGGSSQMPSSSSESGNMSRAR